uniref:Uncharacterized protein n=1 Tax=Bradyrhizobium ottawaense TaxID=931866 RepID=A0A2U8PFJ3_9BRAD|nr:hypothetical protein CIT37_32110 [Bradyrhizobium ottawaense]
MCIRCDEVDLRIAQYERLRSAATDPLAIELLKIVINDFLNEKTALHRDGKPTTLLGELD